jgi:hypothetical protein
MILTCPTCGSGLEVPDGTSAYVRCPACRAVFAPPAEPPAELPAGPPPAPVPTPTRAERVKPPRSRRPTGSRTDEDEDNEAPGHSPPPQAPTRAAAKPENRDFDPPDPEEVVERKSKRGRKRGVSKLSAEERDALLRAFRRAAHGSRLLMISFGLFMLSMVLIIGFYIQSAFPAIQQTPEFVSAAGAVGAIGWVLGAIGVGLCLSGPASPGHWMYGTAAAGATALHLLLLVILAAQGTDYSPARSLDPDGPARNLGLIPTRLDAVTFYLTKLFYPDLEFVPKGEMAFSIVVGLIEIIRTTLILMLLSCLAQAAGDRELSHQCTRAAGFTSFGPGFMALGMFLFAVVMAETRAGQGGFAKVLFVTLVMGTYAILMGCLFPALMAAREVTDACDEPYRSQITDL